MGCVSFFKSSRDDIKANSAMFVGEYSEQVVSSPSFTMFDYHCTLFPILTYVFSSDRKEDYVFRINLKVRLVVDLKLLSSSLCQATGKTNLRLCF